jgi:hypothetical protein
MAATRDEKADTLKRVIDFANEAQLDQLASDCKATIAQILPDDDAKWRFFGLDPNDQGEYPMCIHADSSVDHRLPDGTLFATDRRIAGSCGYDTYQRTVYLHDHIRREVYECITRKTHCGCVMKSCRCVKVTTRAPKRPAEEPLPPPAPALRGE